MNAKTAELKHAVELAAKVVENVSVELDGTAVKVVARATDFELVATLQAEDIHAPATIRVSAKHLLKTLKQAKASVANLSVGDGLQIRSGALNATIPPATGFDVACTVPAVSADARPSYMDLDDLDDLDWVLKAMSRDATRPHLSALYLDAEKQMMVATDGHRLHAAPWPTTVNALIPGNVAAILGKLKGTSTITVDKTSIVIKAPSATLRFRNVLSRRDYPPWATLMGQLDAMKVRIVLGKTNASVWAKALRGLKNTTFVVNGTVEATCHGDDCDVRLSLPTNDKVWRDYNAAQELTIGFNARYISEALLGGDCNLHLPSEPFSPCRVISGERQAFVMPIRL